MRKAILIPPSYHFLKTLVNYFLDTCDLSTFPYTWCVFPTKRAGLFFKHYLTKALKRPCFLPKILSLEEFVNSLYLKTEETPLPLGHDLVKALLFAEFLREKEGALNLSYAFEWAVKFLEVFEEIEKEGKVPKNLLYPPQGLPEIAVEFFEKLKDFYSAYKEFSVKCEFVSFSERLARVAELLGEKLEEAIKGASLESLWFIGLAALRGAEEKIIKSLKDFLPNTHFVFESDLPLPEILERTTRQLDLKPELIEDKYRFKRTQKSLINFYEASNVITQIQSAVSTIKSVSEDPDEVCIVLPNSSSLLPLMISLNSIQELPAVNITLQCPIARSSLTQLFFSIIKAQKGYEEEGYEVGDYLEVLKNPFLKGFDFLEGLSFSKLVDDIETWLRSEGIRRIKLADVETICEKYGYASFNFIKNLHKNFFRNWESLNNFKALEKAITDSLNFLAPLIEKLSEDEDWEGIYFRNYLYVFETQILPVLEEIDFVKDLEKGFVLEVFNWLLKKGVIPFSGDPLKGLQVMGFLETRLLSFKNLIILDVNEGVLPPTSDFNPLLTDEIKRYLEIPVYKNELWWYYFKRLVESSERVHIFYVFSEKAGAEDFKEPSRFVQRLKWELEKQGKALEENKIILSYSPITPKKGIKKTKKHREYLLRLLENSARLKKISRYFVETYLKCQVNFYFKYILKLERPKKLGMEPTDVGNFLHEFFKDLFGKYEGKSISFKEIWEKEEPLKKLEKIWEDYGFSTKINKLLHFFSKEIALKSIENYFNYLIKKEETQKLKYTKVLGVEIPLTFVESFEVEDGKKIKIGLEGILDFLVKRREGIDKYLILDYKSNPSISSGKKKVKALLEKNKTLDEDPYSSYELFEALGSAFQLLFYFYLFYKNREKFIETEKNKPYIINAGFVTPTDFKYPEKFVFEEQKKGGFTKVYRYFETEFEKLLSSVFSHMLRVDMFYFPPDEALCEYCEFKIPCKNFKHLL